MTWLELKTELERLGVTDEMEVDYLDLSCDHPIHLEITHDKTSFTAWS